MTGGHNTTGDPIVFRGLRGRTLADQAEAMQQGYTNMTEYAIDELGRMVHELTQRVDDLEEQAGTQPLPERT